MKKASSLTPGDLERIAVLKRCGLWDMASGVRVMSASEHNFRDIRPRSGASPPGKMQGHPQNCGIQNQATLPRGIAA